MHRLVVASGLAIVLGGQSAGAMAAGWSPSLSITATSDERRRGLSWSDGRAALSGRIDVAPADGLGLSLSATSLRRSPRHDGAALGLDVSASYRLSFGAIEADAQITHHAFPGRDGLDYAELGGGLTTLIGPVQMEGFALYAPSQDAIGGDNLYLGATASLALVGTPWTLRAHVGRSSGDSDSDSNSNSNSNSNSVRSLRFRPRGKYADAGLSVEYVGGPMRIGLFYTDSFAFAQTATRTPTERDMGSRVVARIGFDLGR